MLEEIVPGCALIYANNLNQSYSLQECIIMESILKGVLKHFCPGWDKTWIRSLCVSLVGTAQRSFPRLSRELRSETWFDAWFIIHNVETLTKCARPMWILFHEVHCKVWSSLFLSLFFFTLQMFFYFHFPSGAQYDTKQDDFFSLFLRIIIHTYIHNT